MYGKSRFSSTRRFLRPCLPKPIRKLLSTLPLYKSQRRIQFDKDYRTVNHQLCTLRKYLCELHESNSVQYLELNQRLGLLVV